MSNKHFGVQELDIVDLVKDYYRKRGLTYPSFDNAMKFLQTELAEVYELDLARIGGWVRNNPQNKPEFSKEKLAEELGDAIMMLIVAGLAENVNPIQALESKMQRKLGKKVEKNTNSITVTGKAYILTEEEAKDLQVRFEEKDGN